MAESASNNTKNVNTGQTPFQLNCGYYPRDSFKKDIDLLSQSKTAVKLLAELQKLMTVCRENFHHAQKV